MIILSASEMVAQKAMCYGAAISEFQDEKKAVIATDAYMLGVDYLHKMPVGCNIGDDFEEKCRLHIKSNLKAKPSGFFFVPIIGGWLFSQLLDAVISWAVWRLLDIYFGDTFDKYWHKPQTD